MDDVWFGQDAAWADYEACLRALSIGRRQLPLLAIDIRAGESRLILASRSLFALFGVANGKDFLTRLLGDVDPGGRRLRAVSRDLPLEGAPCLEKLRFFLGPGTEVLTFLCRRVSAADGIRFVAAVLGQPAGLLPAEAAQRTHPAASSRSQAEADGAVEVRSGPMVQTGLAGPMNVQAIQAMLRARWPTSRTIRFVWQTDANLVCTQITPNLGDIVGPANADLVGRDMIELAALIDPSGRFERALDSRKTWSGLQVLWPITDAAAAVAVGLGAIPFFDRDQGFEGFRGYGVLDRERAVPGDTICLTKSGRSRAAMTGANLLQFPGSKELSAEDQEAFVALGEELREEAGLEKAEAPQSPEDSPASTTDPAGNGSGGTLSVEGQRASGIGRHGLAILDRLALGILVSRGNVPIFANRHMLDSLGFRDEDALHDAGGLGSLFNDAPDGAAADQAVRLRGRSGQVLSRLARVQTIDWDGLPATLLTLHPDAETSDVSPAHRDAELHELRAILETATDGVGIIDDAYNILSLNRSGEALLGCDRGKVVGHPFLSLFAQDNRDLVRSYLEGLASNATNRLLNDGREFIVDAHQGAIPVFMTLGRLSGTPDDRSGARFCALFRDLTHWKKVEKDLESAKHDAESANDRKSDFLAKISHEIRTPLNAIIGFAEVMMDERLGPVGSERYKDYLRDIHTSGTHVMSLVNDLLDLSKIEAGKMELAVEDIDVNKVIGECVAIMQPQASTARVIVRLSLSPTLPHVKADERSLRQIVLNILSNAVKFNEPGGQVIVATAATETGHVVIRIRDTGPGMSENDVAAALEPFRQLPTARSSVGGTGLGLPLTKALVEANEATFTIRSKTQQGTLVEVAFPPTRVLAA